jgi:hypothetical protein
MFDMGSLVKSEQVPVEAAEAAEPNPEEAKPGDVRKKKRESRKICLELATLRSSFLVITATTSQSVAIKMGQRLCSKGGPDFCMRTTG